MGENILGSVASSVFDNLMHSRTYGGVWRPEDAALTQLYAAVSPQIRGQKISGKYFHPIARERTPSFRAFNRTLQRRLWEMTDSFISNWKRNHAYPVGHQTGTAAGNLSGAAAHASTAE